MIQVLGYIQTGIPGFHHSMRYAVLQYNCTPSSYEIMNHQRNPVQSYPECVYTMPPYQQTTTQATRQPHETTHHNSPSRSKTMEDIEECNAAVVDDTSNVVNGRKNRAEEEADVVVVRSVRNNDEDNISDFDITPTPPQKKSKLGRPSHTVWAHFTLDVKSQAKVSTPLQ